MFSVLIFLKSFVYPVNGLNISTRRTRLTFSLKGLLFSFNSFSKRVNGLNYSPRRIDNRTGRSKHPPKRAFNFPSMGRQFSSKRLTYTPKRLIYPLKRLSSKSPNCGVWARVVCHALSNQVLTLALNIELKAKMYHVTFHLVGYKQNMTAVNPKLQSFFPH